MSKEFAKQFYQSTAWRKTRKAFIASVFGLCHKCRKPGYIVHHVKPITPENIYDFFITLSWDNLMYLCQNCHNAIHAGSQPVREDVMFDSQGQLVKR